MKALKHHLVAAVLVVAMAAVQSATAAPVPADHFSCGVTVLTQCNETAHFSTIGEELTPLASASPGNCPAFVLNDYGVLSGTGNGVEHSIVNDAGDGWATTTFTGTATITPYLDPEVATPDLSVSPFTGHVTEWFGASFNRDNMVVHGTFHFEGTNSARETLRVTDISHVNTNAANPFGPPNSFEITHCG
jgi:hypothetical protein